MGEAYSTYEKQEMCVRGFGGVPRGKDTTWKPRRRWKDNIKVDIQEWGVWTGSIWSRIGTGGGLL